MGDWAVELEGILVGAFGDKVAIGFLFGKLKKITPDDIYTSIKENKQLFADVKDEEWIKYRRLAKKGHADRLTNEVLIKAFRRKRCDLLNVIWNLPQGRPWIYGQVNILREKLGLPLETS
jgi:hypothetical protein